MRISLAWWLFEFAALFALWFLLTGHLQGSEALCGGIAAALGATAAEAVRDAEHPRFLPYWRWVLEAWRLPAQILKETVPLLRNLGRSLKGEKHSGRFRRVPFRAGGTDARSVARRALAILYSTISPNTIVIGIERRRNVMILHLLEGTEVPPVIGILEERK